MYQSNYIYWNLEVPDPKSILDFAEAKPSSTPAQTAGGVWASSDGSFKNRNKFDFVFTCRR